MNEQVPALSTLDLIRDEQRSCASLCLKKMRFSELTHEQTARPFLHAQERAYFDSLPQSPRRDSYLIGRHCAKQALAHHLNDQAMTAMLVRSGVFGQPVLHHAGVGQLQLSISHSQGYGAALVYPEAHPMAVDIEVPVAAQMPVIAAQLTDAERRLVRKVNFGGEVTAHTWIWTVKEALGKAIRAGLTVPLQVYELSTVHAEQGCLVAYFVNFSQYKAVSFPWHGALVTIVLPKFTALQIAAAGISISARK